jgi:hypothetical protein
MPIQPNRKYIATVTRARADKSSKGTPGLFFSLATNDGPTEYVVWLSEAARKRAEKTMKDCFGATPAQMADKTKLALLLDELEGRQVDVATVMETYLGKDKVKCAWMNPVRKSEDDKRAEMNASFGGSRSQSNEGAPW